MTPNTVSSFYMVSCRECDATQLEYDDVGSLVCTSCGTLVDPEQAVLAQHDDHSHTPFYSVLRTRSGWNLSQTKQDRDRKNTIAMSTFINSVLSRLNNPGLSPRAEAIFTQAMSKGNYKWGRKAKLIAGASIAIALREAHKSDSLRDIAFLLDESPVSLSRTFQSVVSLLNLSLASTDPAVHLPILHAHLQSLIHPETLSPSPPSQHLPHTLVSILTPLSLQTAVRTATSLSQLLSQFTPPLPIIHLPTPPTACALFILSLEAETRAPLPHLGDLTRALGTRFALAAAVVSSRYKILYDLIEEWIRHVPWLDQFVYKGKGRGASARSKVPKRTIVAKGIKDVIQFQEEIWLSRMQHQRTITLDLELDPGENATEGEENGGDDHDGVTTPTVASSRTNVRESDITPPPHKKRKVERKGGAMSAAYRFLLDPLSVSVPKEVSGAATSHGEVSLLTHILTCPSDELSRGVPPTRLQLLAASRGGSTPENIADEELFAEGELEALLRSEQEREALRPLFQLNWGDETAAKEPPMRRPKSPAIPTESKRGAKRINMDALARLLGGEGDGAGVDEEEVRFPDEDDTDYLWGWDDVDIDSSRQRSLTEGAELVGDWRPASSDDDRFGNYRNSVEDRYEEEL